jgi:hypothetical protein
VKHICAQLLATALATFAMSASSLGAEPSVVGAWKLVSFFTVDAIREARSPFSPDAVVREQADLLKRYHVEAVVGDRYGGEWPREKFKEYACEPEATERLTTK